MGAQIGSVEAVATFKNSDTKIDLAGTFKYPIFLKKILYTNTYTYAEL